MGWEPLTYCRECGEAFDAYVAPEDRICECCKEFLADMELERALKIIAEHEAKHEPR